MLPQTVFAENGGFISTYAWVKSVGLICCSYILGLGSLIYLREISWPGERHLLLTLVATLSDWLHYRALNTFKKKKTLPGCIGVSLCMQFLIMDGRTTTVTVDNCGGYALMPWGQVPPLPPPPPHRSIAYAFEN